MTLIIRIVLIFVTETISRTDEGQPRPKYIFNKCGTNIYFLYFTEGLVHHHHRILKKIFRDLTLQFSHLKCAKVQTLVSDMVRDFFFGPESSVLFSITAMLARRARGYKIYFKDAKMEFFFIAGARIKR